MDLVNRNMQSPGYQWVRVNGEREGQIVISTISIGMVNSAIEHAPNLTARKRTVLRKRLRNTIRSFSSGRIYDFDTRAALVWGQIRQMQNAAGNPASADTSQIIATALADNLQIAGYPDAHMVPNEVDFIDVTA